ncbi:MAG TPA: B12-binding domain-containing radical SAM protein [Lachnospiraceae bacterium]|nr:B12-binding domain-containing radical SAM protein [uncultured Lachnoclostridium sp.]HAU85433.1 B12-binding domain-containing radical SAM protein [Lachnospiraceae bacterium]
MKILLTAINAKYIHSNLAIYELSAYAEKYKENIELAEYTINNQQEFILTDIYKRKPDVIAFSCYIWNIGIIENLLKEIRQVMPDTPIWLGGPEVSYDVTQGLLATPYADGIMIGEGECTFKELAQYYVEKNIELKDIRGIAYRWNGEIKVNPYREPMNLSDVPFPYSDFELFKNKILYYETSRGCPYSCSYCLSSIERGVRLRDLELVKKELQIFLDAKVPQVKFIDRTFNCNPAHAMGIWNYIHEHDNGLTNFHFEIAADILRENELELLNKMRPGLVQLEIGVQSTNPDTIKAINRKMDFNVLTEKVNAVHRGNNIHQHLDLIAGLPYEGYESFGKSFDDVYGLRPNQLQLGFLKVLKGSPIYPQAQMHNIVYRKTAPYEVLFTKWLPFDDVLRLKEVEDVVEVYYNSGQFEMSIQFLEHFFQTPFALYEALGEYYEAHGLFGVNHTRIARYEILLDFFKERVIEGDAEVFAEILVYDLYLRENLKSRPKFAKDYGEYKKLYREFYEDVERVKALLPGYEDYSSKVLSRVTHAEHFSIDVPAVAKTGVVVREETIIVFDYKNRNPLDHQAMAISI